MIVLPTRPDLSSIPGFGRLDAAENEDGRLSGRQRQILVRGLAVEIAWTALALSPFAATLVTSGLDLVGVAALVCALWLAQRWVTLAADICRGGVSAIDGDARAEDDGDSEGRSYWIAIGGLKLPTTSRIATEFRSGGPYRVCYLPRANNLVNAQTLEGWRSLPISPPKKRAWFRFGIGLD